VRVALPVAFSSEDIPASVSSLVVREFLLHTTGADKKFHASLGIFNLTEIVVVGSKSKGQVIAMCRECGQSWGLLLWYCQIKYYSWYFTRQDNLWPYKMDTEGRSVKLTTYFSRLGMRGIYFTSPFVFLIWYLGRGTFYSSDLHV
jgi:hypothetical protein